MAFVAIPDAIASVILAGVNPTHGFYALMVGTPVGSLFTSSQFMNTGLTAAMMVEVVEAVSDSASRRSPRQELLIAQKLFFIPFEHLSDDAKLRIECVPLRGSHLRGTSKQKILKNQGSSLTCLVLRGQFALVLYKR